MKIEFNNQPIVTEKAKLIDMVKSTKDGIIILTQRVCGNTYSGNIIMQYEISLKKFILTELESFDDQLTNKNGDITKKIIGFEVNQ